MVAAKRRRVAAGFFRIMFPEMRLPATWLLQREGIGVPFAWTDGDSPISVIQYDFRFVEHDGSLEFFEHFF
jgi:hypothetical protein